MKAFRMTGGWLSAETAFLLALWTSTLPGTVFMACQSRNPRCEGTALPADLSKSPVTRRSRYNDRNITNRMCHGKNFVTYACQATRQPAPTNSSTERPRCQAKDVGPIILCAVKQLAMTVPRFCGGMGIFQSTHSTKYCLTIMPIIFFVDRSVRKRLSNVSVQDYKVCSSSATVCDMGRELMQKCSLASSPSPPVPVRPPSNLECLLTVRSGNLWTIAARLSLTVLTSKIDRGYDILRAEDFPLGCWDPELLRAQRLYDTPGRWDVDDQCISMLQATFAKAWKIILWDRYNEFKTAMARHRPTFRVLQSLFNYLGRPSSRKILALWPHWLEFNLYKPFKRMRQTAAVRRLSKSENVTLSCKGLRGSRNEVKATLQTLFLQVAINQRETRRKLDTATGLSLLTLLLPCIIDKVI